MLSIYYILYNTRTQYGNRCYLSVEHFLIDLVCVSIKNVLFLSYIGVIMYIDYIYTTVLINSKIKSNPFFLLLSAEGGEEEEGRGKETN